MSAASDLRQARAKTDRRPSRGAVARVMPTEDRPNPEAGSWKLFEKGPGPGEWWAMPVDDVARAWAKRWPNAITQGCALLPGRALVPR